MDLWVLLGMPSRIVGVRVGRTTETTTLQTSKASLSFLLRAGIGGGLVRFGSMASPTEADSLVDHNIGGVETPPLLLFLTPTGLGRASG